ncbi:MAG: hypothetical protein JWQ88_2611, partial [Rhodoferax sp.]|nr:hypothetical protein [Rhodoferax sp.]
MKAKQWEAMFMGTEVGGGEKRGAASGHRHSLPVEQG